MKKYHAILLLLGGVFLAYLVWKIGIRELWHELVSLGWGLALFILLEFAAEGIHTIGWRYCLTGPDCRIPWIRLFQIRMAGFAINYLTPTAALGGEVTKAALLSSYCRGPEAVTGVLAGKLCAGMGHLLFVALGSVIVIWIVTLPAPVWVAMCVSGGLVAGGILTFLLLQKHGRLGDLIRWLAKQKLTGRAFQNASRHVTEVDEALKNLYRERPRALALAVCWHMAGYAAGIVQTLWFFSFLHQPVPKLAATAVWILGMWFDLLTFAVPLNLGTLEGTRIIAFKAIGSNAVMGMTYGVALRLAQLACACFGLVSYAWLNSRDRRPPVTGRTPSLKAGPEMEPKIGNVDCEKIT